METRWSWFLLDDGEKELNPHETNEELKYSGMASTGNIHDSPFITAESAKKQGQTQRP